MFRVLITVFVFIFIVVAWHDTSTGKIERVFEFERCKKETKEASNNNISESLGKLYASKEALIKKRQNTDKKKKYTYYTKQIHEINKAIAILNSYIAKETDSNKDDIIRDLETIISEYPLDLKNKKQE